MNLFSLASLVSRFPFTIVLLFLMGYFFVRIKKTDERLRHERESFFEKERLANSTRRQSLDSLDYIVIPFDELPMSVCSDDEIIASCIHEVNLLKDDKIANFTGITNTDLKLEYGAPNINLLMRYDSNFTSLCRSLATWSDRLFELEKFEEALVVAEYAIKIRSDVSATYYLCAKLYMQFDTPDKISWLKRTADTLNSAMRPSILRKLDELYPDIDAI